MAPRVVCAADFIRKACGNDTTVRAREAVPSGTREHAFRLSVPRLELHPDLDPATRSPRRPITLQTWATTLKYLQRAHESNEREVRRN